MESIKLLLNLHTNNRLRNYTDSGEKTHTRLDDIVRKPGRSYSQGSVPSFSLTLGRVTVSRSTRRYRNTHFLTVEKGRMYYGINKINTTESVYPGYKFQVPVEAFGKIIIYLIFKVKQKIFMDLLFSMNVCLNSSFTET